MLCIHNASKRWFCRVSPSTQNLTIIFVRQVLSITLIVMITQIQTETCPQLWGPVVSSRMPAHSGDAMLPDP